MHNLIHRYFATDPSFSLLLRLPNLIVLLQKQQQKLNHFIFIDVPTAVGVNLLEQLPFLIVSECHIFSLLLHVQFDLIEVQCAIAVDIVQQPNPFDLRVQLDSPGHQGLVHILAEYALVAFKLHVFISELLECLCVRLLWSLRSVVWREFHDPIVLTRLSLKI